MKKLLYIPAILLLAACSKPEGRCKKAELIALKKQEAELSAKINKLQTEIGTSDTVKLTDVAVMEVKPMHLPIILTCRAVLMLRIMYRPLHRYRVSSQPFM